MGDLAEDQVVEGLVENVIHRNEDSGYAVVRLRLDDGRDRVVVGLLGDCELEDRLRVAGRLEDHPRFGRRFRAESVQRVSPSTLRGIERYLAGPRVQGIGPELARRLVAHFGTSTLEILDRSPERVTEVEGIGEKRARAIAASWKSETLRRELLVFLQGHGLGPGTSLRVLAELGADSMPAIRNDPYILAEKVSGIGFRTADRLAEQLGIEKQHPSRLKAGLRWLLDEALGEGHTNLPAENLLERASRLLGCDANPVRHTIRDLVVAGALVVARPRDRGTPWSVHLADAWACEREAATLVLDLLEKASRSAVPAPPPAFADERLSDEQNAVVASIRSERLAVLTGGPGVGKTTILQRLVSLWSAEGKSVVLASPTGRAAKRLEEVVGRPASTIHRLLKFDPRRRRFLHGQDDPLQADVVVCDEASMLDLPLFVHLVRALRSESRLLLVGDADQLPSVGPGSVLADLVGAANVPTYRLTRVFRQARESGIVRMAHQVLEGELDLSLGRMPGDLRFIDCEGPEEGAAVVRDLVVRSLPRELGLDPVSDIQVLCPMNRGPAGTQELNRCIQEGLGKDRPAVHGPGCIFHVGDRVMQTRNDYDRELFNGDVGAIRSIDVERGEVEVVFDGRTQVYKREQLHDLVPAWAMSVHKSQGGEYPAVILTLFPQHFMLLRRQVLYTAITRARRSLTIVGTRRCLAAAVERNEAAHRFGHLREWIEGVPAEAWNP